MSWLSGLLLPLHRPTTEMTAKGRYADSEFTYGPWRHGGYYVNEIRYPNGAAGCVAGPDKNGRWWIACDEREAPESYPTRKAAATAERNLIASGVLG